MGTGRRDNGAGGAAKGYSLWGIGRGSSSGESRAPARGRVPREWGCSSGGGRGRRGCLRRMLGRWWCRQSVIPPP